MGGIDRLMDELRIEFRSHPPPNCVVRFAPTRGGRHVALSPVFLFAFLARMTALRIRGRADLVHVNLSSHGSAARKVVLCRYASVLRLPYVLHLHGSDFRQYMDGLSGWQLAAVKRMFADAARIVVLGSVWKDFVEGRVPSVAGRVHILPNASPALNKVSQADMNGEVRILFLGQLGPRKGVPELVEALARCTATGGWRAVIAGDGDLEGTRSALAAAGLQHRVEVPGWVGRDTVIDLIVNSDILVLPSHDENLPMSVIEGMGAGLAIVATPVGAVPDIIDDGKTGLLVPPGDAEALAAALRRLIEDPALRERLGTAARQYHREHLDIGPYAEELVAIWRQAAGAP